MKFQGAVVKEKGIKFAIVVVKRHIVQNSYQAKKAISTFQPIFGPIPVILMGQDSRGRATYYGRRDIVRFLAKVPLKAIPWREYTIS